MNLAQGILTNAPGLAGTTLTLESEAQASAFAFNSEVVYVGIRQTQTDTPSITNTEFVKVTAVSGAELTVERARITTSAIDFTAGAYAYETITKEVLDLMRNRIEAGLIGGEFRTEQTFTDLETNESTATDIDSGGDVYKRYRAFFIPYSWDDDTAVVLLKGYVTTSSGASVELTNWKIIFKDEFEALPEYAELDVVDRDTDPSNYLRLANSPTTWIVRGADNQIGYVNTSNSRVIREIKVRSIGDQPDEFGLVGGVATDDTLTGNGADDDPLGVASEFSSTEKTKLGNLPADAEANEPTNLGKTTSSTGVTITSSTGADVVISQATQSQAGAMRATDKTKLDGVESNATADQTASEIKTAYETNNNTNAFTDDDETKLDGIEAGATAGGSDGVVDGGSVTGTTLTLSRTVGDDVVIPGLPSGNGNGNGGTYTNTALATDVTAATAPGTPIEISLGDSLTTGTMITFTLHGDVGDNEIPGYGLVLADQIIGLSATATAPTTINNSIAFIISAEDQTLTGTTTCTIRVWRKDNSTLWLSETRGEYSTIDISAITFGGGSGSEATTRVEQVAFNDATSAFAGGQLTIIPTDDGITVPFGTGNAEILSHTDGDSTFTFETAGVYYFEIQTDFAMPLSSNRGSPRAILTAGATVIGRTDSFYIRYGTGSQASENVILQGQVIVSADDTDVSLQMENTNSSQSVTPSNTVMRVTRR